MQAHSDVAEALDRLRELGAVRRPDDPVLGEFLSLYYFELPEDDVDDRKIDDIYAVGVAHLDLGRGRRSARRSSGSSRPTASVTVGSRRTRWCSWSPTTCRSSSTRCAWCSNATGSTSTCSSTRC